ncbi:MAG: YicC/YloC family endoribonuclease [Solirubrobacterales bacterium]
MVRSMTGFGRAEVAGSMYQITCEIKCVNHRFFDFNLRMPRRYGALEDRVREKLKQSVSRGRVEVSCNIEKSGTPERALKVDNELAITYYKCLKDLAFTLEIPADIRLIDVFRLPEVFSLQEAEDDLEHLWNVMDQALEQAMAELVRMREKEGQTLVRDIVQRTGMIVETVAQVEERSPLVVRDYAERLRKRLNDLMGEATVDENRLAQEIAVFADRASITEEIVRLRSHCQQMQEYLNGSESVGRKCDFLVQEMLREVNTIASKANDLTISQLAVDMKAELEKIREQIQNIE